MRAEAIAAREDVDWNDKDTTSALQIAAGTIQTLCFRPKDSVSHTQQ
jgi:hypothetical protein